MLNGRWEGADPKGRIPTVHWQRIPKIVSAIAFQIMASSVCVMSVQSHAHMELMSNRAFIEFNLFAVVSQTLRLPFSDMSFFSKPCFLMHVSL